MIHAGLSIPLIAEHRNLVTSANVNQALSATRRAAAMIERALKMDASALVRVRKSGSTSVDIFVSTPLSVIAMQRIPGALPEEADGAVVMASDAKRALANFQPGDDAITIGPTLNLMWTGTLPPLIGYEVLDTVPADTFRQLHTDMGRENREESGPMGVARSLLDQTLLTVRPGDQEEAGEPGRSSVDISGRVVAAVGGLGIATAPRHADLAEYDFVRVSANASWIRIDALFGTLFTPRPGGLARVPQPR